MLMIVATHTNHGGFDFPVDSITLNRLWQQFIGMGGGLGNSIFVMLSGYFLINSREVKISRVINLWVRMFFYAAPVYIVLLWLRIEPFSSKMFAYVLMPFVHSFWWFATNYLVIYLAHPYINRFLHSFTREEYKNFLMTAVLYWCVLSTLTRPSLKAAEIIDFFCAYCIAGYFRLHASDLGGVKYLRYALGFIGINYLTVIIFDVVGLKIPIVGEKAGHFCIMMRPFTLLAALCLLLYFRSLKRFNSKVINTIASVSFGVYLIHENRFIRPLVWKKLFHVASFQDSPYLIPYIIAVILAVYVSCTLIELLRSKIFRILSRGYLS